jgi:hypothetical protein
LWSMKPFTREHFLELYMLRPSAGFTRKGDVPRFRLEAVSLIIAQALSGVGKAPGR